MLSLAHASHLIDVASLWSFCELDITIISILQMESWCSEKLSKKKKRERQRIREREKLGNFIQKPLLSKWQSWDGRWVCWQQVRDASPPRDAKWVSEWQACSRFSCGIPTLLPPPPPTDWSDAQDGGGEVISYTLHWSISNFILYIWPNIPATNVFLTHRISFLKTLFLSKEEAQ